MKRKIPVHDVIEHRRIGYPANKQLFPSWYLKLYTVLLGSNRDISLEILNL